MSTKVLLRVNGVDVGTVWYSAVAPYGWTRGAWYGMLFARGDEQKPLGPYRTEKAVKRAIERTAKAEGHWPELLRAATSQEEETPP